MSRKEYKEYFYKVQLNQDNFNRMLDFLEKSSDLSEKLEIAQKALQYATKSNTAYFTSSILENFFIEFANQIDIDNYDIEHKSDSFLHVLSQGYNTGGHTRVVERWIDNAPANQTHSVVILEPNNEKLVELEKAVKSKAGTYIKFEMDLSLEKRALKLRELGLKYQYIVLHTHMEDPTATVAFGTEKFTRPVLFYNHASHLFWIGKAITDVHLDLLADDEITTVKRNIKDKFFLGIPMKNIEFKKVNRFELRKKLNLPLDKKIIVSAGSGFKYNPICNDNFVENVKKIIDEDTYVYVIGVDKSDKMWLDAFNTTKGHIIPLGRIDFEKGYLDYIGSADLYLDSFPLGGYTAVIDAVSLSVPSLTLKMVLPPLDYISQTEAFCNNVDEFVYKSKKVLNDEAYASSLIKNTQDSLAKSLSKEVWNKKLDDLLKIVPQKHKVKYFLDKIDYHEIDDLAVTCNFLNNSNFKNEIIREYTLDEIRYGTCYKKLGIPFIFQILSYKKADSKIRVIKLFNIKIFEYKKRR